ncbi:hypothetical protein N9164_15195 [Draconibacterium sp.]|nr:hypothetical protein [Draconibacterium sp.]
MRNIVLLSILFLFASCSDVLTEDDSNANNNINIYLVKTDIGHLGAMEVDLDTMELESTPWVKSSDIEFYDWSAHAIYLNKEINKGELSARNFVVTSSDKRLFMGVFWPMYMSSVPMIPSIMPEDDWFSPKDVIRFHSFGWQFPESLTENEEFKLELIKAGLLREGIEVEITSLNRRSSTTLKYTFKVTNCESEIIYVLDPNKMGASRFHYYTNGVSINQGEKYFWPHEFETKASEKIDSRWYHKLFPGKSISRTVEMKGYQSLPTGKVNASFSFPGPILKKAKEWKKTDGRIWIGNQLTRSEIAIN